MDGKASGAMLRCFSPTFAENLVAQPSTDSNGTSLVLVHDHLGKRIVFAADSVIPQWRKVHERRGNKTLKCDILAVPHHGGLIDGSDSDLDWLYDHALKCDVAIFSVGTVRNPKHPRPDVVSKLQSIGANVLCTEITSSCHHDPATLRPGVLTPQKFIGRAVSTTKKSLVACAGTVLATISQDSVAVDRLDLHQASVDALATSPTNRKCPLCRLTGSAVSSTSNRCP